MQGHARVLDVLSQVLRNELTAVNQYFLHSRMCENWGYQTLAAQAYGETIEEMKHADDLLKRILFLDGTPNMSDYGRILIGRTVKEQLDNDLALETEALATLRSGIQTCLEAGDHVSRQLLEKILSEEEHHIDWIETQLHQIREVGYEGYLAQQIHKRS
jgi:bacterioferritin